MSKESWTNSKELAAWLDKQGDGSWWSVDGDPLLTGLVSFPCPSTELASKLRELDKPLCFKDKKTHEDGGRDFLLCWEGGKKEWLLCEDKETAAWANGEAEIKREEAEQKRSYAEDALRAEQSTLGGQDSIEGLDDLIGGKILDVGFHPAAQEGGLAIDYEKDGKRLRMVFGYTELGLWIEWRGPQAACGVTEEE